MRRVGGMDEEGSMYEEGSMDEEGGMDKRGGTDKAAGMNEEGGECGGAQPRGVTRRGQQERRHRPGGRQAA